MRKIGRVSDGKIFVRQEHRRPVNEIALAILLRRVFSDDLERTTQNKYGGCDGASFVLIRRNSERFGGTGIREVGGISVAERTQIPRFGRIAWWRR